MWYRFALPWVLLVVVFAASSALHRIFPAGSAREASSVVCFYSSACSPPRGARSGIPHISPAGGRLDSRSGSSFFVALYPALPPGHQPTDSVYGQQGPAQEVRLESSFLKKKKILLGISSVSSSCFVGVEV